MSSAATPVKMREGGGGDEAEARLAEQGIEEQTAATKE